MHYKKKPVRTAQDKRYSIIVMYHGSPTPSTWHDDVLHKIECLLGRLNSEDQDPTLLSFFLIVSSVSLRQRFDPRRLRNVAGWSRIDRLLQRFSAEGFALQSEELVRSMTY